MRILCEAGPASIGWLKQLGALFDVNADGTFRLRSVSVTSADGPHGHGERHDVECQ